MSIQWANPDHQAWWNRLQIIVDTGAAIAKRCPGKRLMVPGDDFERFHGALFECEARAMRGEITAEEHRVEIEAFFNWYVKVR